MVVADSEAFQDSDLEDGTRQNSDPSRIGGSGRVAALPDVEREVVGPAEALQDDSMDETWQDSTDGTVLWQQDLEEGSYPTESVVSSLHEVETEVDGPAGVLPD